ncbi:MAG: SDR family oxidoreductase [Gammaproteobacteria bacterium]
MNILVIGANSDIAYALIKQLAARFFANFYLASLDQKALQAKAQDLQTRYQVKVKTFQFDITDYASHSKFYQQLTPKPDGIILASGWCPSHTELLNQFNAVEKLVAINYVGAMSILDIVARDLEQRSTSMGIERKSDVLPLFIVALSSVAGERGRASNYYYGSAKAALTTYLSGLRARLHAKHCLVMTVLPGFVQTKMTAAMPLPKSLTAQPEQVASDILKALIKRKPVVYTRWYWRWIMWIIRLLPETIFLRLSF